MLWHEASHEIVIQQYLVILPPLRGVFSMRYMSAKISTCSKTRKIQIVIVLEGFITKGVILRLGNHGKERVIESISCCFRGGSLLPCFTAGDMETHCLMCGGLCQTLTNACVTQELAVGLEGGELGLGSV